MVKAIDYTATGRRGTSTAVGNAALRGRRSVNYAMTVRVRRRQGMARVPNLGRPRHRHLTVALAPSVPLAITGRMFRCALRLQLTDLGRTGVQGAVSRVCQFQAEAAEIAPDTLEESVALRGRLREIRRHESAQVVLTLAKGGNLSANVGDRACMCACPCH